LFKERRRFARDVVFIPLKINWPQKEHKVTSTKNYSYGGVLIDNPFDDVPEVGTKVTLQLTELIEGHEAPLLPAQVTRVCAAEIAVELLIDHSDTE
jgi:hypothetical protein